MSKKIKTLFAVIAAILVLTIGGTAIVMAQEEELPPTPAPEMQSNLYLEKLAERLGLSVDELTEILQQVRQELRQNAFEQFVNRAVEEGRITDGEAQQILEWWEQRPEAADILLQRLIGSRALGGRRMQQQGSMPMFGRQGGQQQFMAPGQAFQGAPPWANGLQRGVKRGWNLGGPPWLAE